MKYYLFTLLIIFNFSHCVDRAFDSPPIKELIIPFDANSSIEKLKSYYVAGKFVDISDDIKIIGIVIADDKSGNFYKSIILQDSTGGIIIKLDRIGLFASYPIGSKVGIQCKGLTISDYGGLIQIGKGTTASNGKQQLAFIPDLEISKYIYPGPRNQTVTPKKIGINTVRSQDLSTLIQLDDVEFDRADVNKTLATVGGSSFLDLNISDCNNSKILLHTSDFADFASYITPAKHGSIVAVLGKFNTSIQLYLRDTSEIYFDQMPCGNTGGSSENLSIKELRELFTGTTINISNNYTIHGVVISDKDNGNINAQNLFLQDETAGIAIRFSVSHNYKLGQEIELNISNQELSEFNGLLQINNVPLSNSKTGNSGIVIVPKIVDILTLSNNFENFESTLIRINNVNLSKSSDGTFEFNVLANDKTGSINLFTNTKATFAKELFPNNTVDLVVIASEFNGKQILLRNLLDIIGNGGSGSVKKEIQYVRNLYNGSTTNVAENIYIQATVISERNAMNITSQNMVVQDSSGGITIRFTSNHFYNLGDLVEVNLKGLELSKFNGLLQLNNVVSSVSKFISSGNTPTPKLITSTDVVNHLDQYEGQLVLLSNVLISKSSGLIYSGACVVTDNNGSIELFTRSQAIFANDTIPSKSVNLTAIVTQFNKPQLMIRTLDDVKP